MTAPSINLTEQMLRRRPVIGAPVAHGASDHLKRTIGVVLALGTSPRGDIARVFLGSRGSKIMRAQPRSGAGATRLSPIVATPRAPRFAAAHRHG